MLEELYYSTSILVPLALQYLPGYTATKRRSCHIFDASLSIALVSWRSAGNYWPPNHCFSNTKHVRKGEANLEPDQDES
jgi:hypothetical protein